MSRLTRDGNAEPVSRDQILRHERGQGNTNFPCSADHAQDWQPYPVDPHSCCMCISTIHTYSNFLRAVLDISQKATAVKERIDCIDRLHCCTKN